MSEKMGTKNIRMTDEMISACEKYAAEYNAGNANAFVRDAIEFYIEWLNRESTEKFLTPALESVITGKLRDSENRISRMLFKLAVGQNFLAHLYASTIDCDEVFIKTLYADAKDEVRETNGSIRVTDVFKNR